MRKHIENKALFVRKYGELLTMTRYGIQALEYNKLETGTEYVVVIYESGLTKTIDVTCDSEMAILKDVIKGVE